jgi:hypothetical protein
MVAQLSTNIGNVVFYSDDSGVTWNQSAAIIADCNEAQVRK